ncbi:diaminohydroxyphosphoribosylaminopyrimidine deaminase / 5-amino-6-(5-phosphoribosylamino)uracil reductase [Micrococcales bacterium KH10]|nr:diaminohydroxyphosphoribosylaminopyrimidine deaminase / 5-amino-6-(5-phosphoribosylamino)uracil reductase [Micrococcales bacterium KH10]
MTVGDWAKADLAEIPGGAISLAQALDLAVDFALRGPGGGVNPQVGCVLLTPVTAAETGGAPRYRVLSYGWHDGAGTAHAEVAALQRARRNKIDVRGCTAVVTLQPCNSTGRTGPCAQALSDAQVGAVHYAVGDPAAQTARSDQLLRSHGIAVCGPRELVAQSDGPFPVEATANEHTQSIRAAVQRAEELVRPWLHSQRLGRPYVIAKQATSLDGRIAAPDGTSQWITGPRAREHAHRVRARSGAILVGTQTVLTDNPSLTARDCDGSLTPRQPHRIVMGNRDLPADARVRTVPGELTHIRSHNPHDAVKQLWEQGISSVIVEGGSHISAAFFAADLVDEIHTYLAPLVMGERSRSAIADLGIKTLSQAPRYHLAHVAQLGDDVVLIARHARVVTLEGA